MQCVFLSKSKGSLFIYKGLSTRKRKKSPLRQIGKVKSIPGEKLHSCLKVKNPSMSEYKPQARTKSERVN